MTGKTPPLDRRSLLRLQSWLSPAFPIGSFSYSHGLEYAIEAGWVHDRDSLIDWLEADLRHGTLRCDGIFLCESWRAAHEDVEALLETAMEAAAMRGTSELALEAEQTGHSFLYTVRQAWPLGEVADLAELLGDLDHQVSLPVAVGLVARVFDVALDLAVPLYLQAAVANQINAAVRLLPLGQTDGQRAVAALETAVMETAREVEGCRLADLGSAALMVDLAAMYHETQYTRLFRS